MINVYIIQKLYFGIKTYFICNLHPWINVKVSIFQQAITLLNAMYVCYREGLSSFESMR